MTRIKVQQQIQKSFIKWAEVLAPVPTGEWIAQLFLTPNRYQRPEWERDLLKRADEIKLASGRRAWTWGSSGPRVFLLHGWEGRGSQLGAFVDPLLSAGYQVVAWDGPAHGDSPGRSTNLVDFSKALMEDMNSLGSIDTIVAHSMGGAILMMALEAGLKINKGILIASPSQWSTAINGVAEKLNLRPQTFRAVRRSLERRVGRPISSFDVQSWERNREVPFFILHDRADRDVPESEFHRLTQILPQARARLSQGLGHRRILRDPRVIDEVINFVREVA